MFVREEVLVAVGLDVAQARLANMVHGGSLLKAAQATYGEGITGMLRVGPLNSAPVLSRLVEVNFRELVRHEQSAVLTLRWKAIGPGGGLFPVLDADITLTAVDEASTQMRLDGAYRPPLGAAGASLDRAILHRIAAATMRSFIGQLADRIAEPDLAAEASGPAEEQAACARPPPLLE